MRSAGRVFAPYFVGCPSFIHRNQGVLIAQHHVYMLVWTVMHDRHSMALRCAYRPDYSISGMAFNISGMAFRKVRTTVIHLSLAIWICRRIRRCSRRR